MYNNRNFHCEIQKITIFDAKNCMIFGNGCLTRHASWKVKYKRKQKYPAVRPAKCDFSAWKMRRVQPLNPQVAQARYMSSSMWTFALLRDSSDLHFLKICMGKEVNPKKNEKLPLNYNKNRLPEFQLRFLCVLCDFLTDLERFSVV